MIVGGEEHQVRAPKAPTRRYEARQGEIIASAVDVLNRRGVRGMTLGEVAAQLDLVPTGVVYYFRNKEDLAAACFLRSLEAFHGFIDEAQAKPTTRGRIEAFVRAYLETQRRVVLRQGEALVKFNDVRALRSEAVDQAYIEMFRALRRLLDGPEAGALSRPERNARAHLVLSETLWTTVWLPRWEPDDYGRAGARLASVLVDGLAAPGLALPPAALGADMFRTGTPRDPGEMFLRAAIELINAEGYFGASVEKISAKLNVTKGAFYHHNATKDELVLACFERTFDLLRRVTRAAEAASASGLQALVTVACVLIEHQLTGEEPLLRASAITSAPENLQPGLRAQYQRLSDRFASLISDGIADGSIRPLDVTVAAQAMAGMLNAATELRHWAPDIDPAGARERFVRPFFEGLARVS